MKKRVGVFVSCGIIAIIVLFASCWFSTAATPAAKYGGMKEVKVLDGASSSAVFIPFSTRAQIINRIPGIRSTCIAGSITGNLDTLEKGQGEISHSTNSTLCDAAKGEGPFKGKTFKNLAFLSTDEGPRPSIMFVRSDSKINTVQDFKGKHIATSPKGSGTANMWIKMMGYHGITPESMGQSGGRFSFLAPGDVMQGMRDRTIDVFLSSCGYYEASPVHLELVKTTGVKLIPLDPKAVDQYLKEEPMAMRMTVKPGLYNNKDPYQTWAAETQAIVIRRDVPDDLVTDILKALFSKPGRKTFYDAYPTAIPFLLENGLQGSIKEMPVHPAALKFYKENNVLGGKAFIFPATKEEALNNYGGQWDWPWK